MSGTIDPMKGVEPTAMPCLILTPAQASFLALNMAPGPLRRRMKRVARQNRLQGGYPARFVMGLNNADVALVGLTLAGMKTTTGIGKVLRRQLNALQPAEGGEVTP